VFRTLGYLDQRESRQLAVTLIGFDHAIPAAVTKNDRLRVGKED
jgi:hypothetical protein